MRALLQVLAQQAGQVALAVEDAQDRLGDADVLAVIDAGELPDRVGRARHGRGAAADADLEAALLLAVRVAALAADEAEVVEGRAGAVARRRREKAVLNLRGRRWQIGLRSMLRA